MTKMAIIKVASMILDSKRIFDEDARQDLYLQVLEAIANGTEFDGTVDEVAAKIEGLFFKPTINLNWGIINPADIGTLAKDVLNPEEYRITMLYFNNIDLDLISRSFPDRDIIGIVNNAIDHIRKTAIAL